MTATSELLEDVQLLIPVKRLAAAKSRLSSDAATRHAAAEWLFHRTVEVATACLTRDQVVVLTADEHVARQSTRLGVHVMHDPAPDLNSALHVGIRALQRQQEAVSIVVLVADLPRLEPDDLRSVLPELVRGAVPCHVPDHHGTGTTMVFLPPGSRVPMVFGADSARQFTRLGSVAVTGAPRRLRTDLDTPADPFQLNIVHT
jgi:2-phospho-L-lactate/phosphoenolpyruvate guanylyltransferase